MYKYYETSFKNQSLSLKEKFFNLSFSYILFIVILASIGIVVLYSAANGSWRPWAINQLIRFVLGFGVMMVFAMTDIRFFMKIAYPFYFVSLLLLIYVEVRGSIGMGAAAMDRSEVFQPAAFGADEDCAGFGFGKIFSFQLIAEY